MQLFQQQYRITGSFGCRIENIAQSLEKMAGGMKPVIDSVFPLAEFEKGLGDKWRDTFIIAVTEFGRTARINGTTGTDHGTGWAVGPIPLLGRDAPSEVTSHQRA